MERSAECLKGFVTVHKANVTVGGRWMDIQPEAHLLSVCPRSAA